VSGILILCNGVEVEFLQGVPGDSKLKIDTQCLTENSKTFLTTKNTKNTKKIKYLQNPNLSVNLVNY
jgi:hypothetical protein